MTADRFYLFFLWSSFPVALATFITLMFVTAPYGRHQRQGWGTLISNRWGWFIMEFPAAVLFLGLFLAGSAPKTLAAFIFLGMWEAHYVNRAFIYPLRFPEARKNMPLAIPVMGFIFNLGNAFINGFYLFNLSGGYPASWLDQPRTLIGMILFLAGYGINLWSDRSLRSLRKHPDGDYQIPQGGLFRWVSCPNYLGEIIEWTGWAVATWSLPGLSFAVWTFANLAPRARAHHAWYHQRFEAYPLARKALIPGIW